MLGEVTTARRSRVKISLFNNFCRSGAFLKTEMKARLTKFQGRCSFIIRVHVS